VFVNGLSKGARLKLRDGYHKPDI